MRSGGRAQTTALCNKERFRADRLAASRRTEPNLRARSIMSAFSESQARESRRRSKEQLRATVEESETAKIDSKSESISSIQGKFELELGMWFWLSGEGREGEQHGRLSLGFGEAMEDWEWSRRVSITEFDVKFGNAKIANRDKGEACVRAWSA